MTWNALITWVNDDIVSDATMNEQVRDNLGHLFARPHNTATLNETNKSTTSTSFTDVDATDFALSFTPAGSVVDIWLLAVCTYSTTNQRIDFDITKDGTSILGADGICGVNCGSVTGAFSSVFYVKVRIEVTPGVAATYKLRWRTSTGTATLFGGAGGIAQRPQFGVEEVSD